MKTVEEQSSLDWMFWRIVGSESFNESLHDIKYKWTIDELMDAHEFLDIQDAFAQEAELEAKRGA